jgi:hypothetical protein
VIIEIIDIVSLFVSAWLTAYLGSMIGTRMAESDYLREHPQGEGERERERGNEDVC